MDSMVQDVQSYISIVINDGQAGALMILSHLLHKLAVHLGQEFGQVVKFNIYVEPDSSTDTHSGHSGIKCGDLLKTCTVYSRPADLNFLKTDTYIIDIIMATRIFST